MSELIAIDRGPARFVYFIGADETVKIGRAADPAKRMVELQVGCPLELKLLRVIPGDLAAEQWLHQQYAALRVRGEWFTFCPSMLSVAVPEVIADCVGESLADLTHAFRVWGGTNDERLRNAWGWSRIEFERHRQIRRAEAKRVEQTFYVIDRAAHALAAIWDAHPELTYEQALDLFFAARAA